MEVMTKLSAIACRCSTLLCTAYYALHSVHTSEHSEYSEHSEHSEHSVHSDHRIQSVLTVLTPKKKRGNFEDDVNRALASWGSITEGAAGHCLACSRH